VHGDINIINENNSNNKNNDDDHNNNSSSSSNNILGLMHGFTATVILAQKRPINAIQNVVVNVAFGFVPIVEGYVEFFANYLGQVHNSL